MDEWTGGLQVTITTTKKFHSSLALPTSKHAEQKLGQAQRISPCTAGLFPHSAAGLGGAQGRHSRDQFSMVLPAATPGGGAPPAGPAAHQPRLRAQPGT